MVFMLFLFFGLFCYQNLLPNLFIVFLSILYLLGKSVRKNTLKTENLKRSLKKEFVLGFIWWR